MSNLTPETQNAASDDKLEDDYGLDSDLDQGEKFRGKTTRGLPHHTDVVEYHRQYRKRRREIKEETFSNLFDPNDPDCLMQRVPLEFVEPMKNAVAQIPRYFMKTEKEMVEIAEADRLDYTLRIRFWDEYSRAVTFPDLRMSWHKFLSHVIGKKQFLNYYCLNPKKVVFVLYPPKNYQTALETILEQGLEKIFEALKLPILNKDGVFDRHAFKEIMEATKWAAVNLKGMPVQRLQIQQHTINQNLNSLEAKKQAEVEKLAAMSIEELERMDKALSIAQRATIVTEGVVIGEETQGDKVRSE